MPTLPSLQIPPFGANIVDNLYARTIWLSKLPFKEDQEIYEQVSISSMFYVQIFRTNVVFSTYFLALLKNSYEKCARKTLMKLTPGVNFINILQAHFLYESELSSFSLVTFCCVIFLGQNIGAKCARKMLMKLTPESSNSWEHLNAGLPLLKKCWIRIYK